MKNQAVAFLVAAVAHVASVSAFAPGNMQAHVFSAEDSSTALFRGAKNAKKQMDLAKKMALAKQQKRAAEDAEAPDGKSMSNAATEEEIKAENDRKRFDQLLNSASATAMLGEFNAKSDYLTRQQQEEAATAGFRGVDRLFEYDPAPTEPFESLVSMRNEEAIGETGAKTLVPWIHKNTARHKDYLVVITDPREKSLECRQTIASLCQSLPPAIKDKIVFVNADSPPENRRWLKKNKIEDATIYSDEKREWMREYTALGEKRWSMTMFVLGDGRSRSL